MSEFQRRWPWLAPMIFALVSLFISQILHWTAPPNVITRHLAIMQTLTAAAFAFVGIHRLISRWHGYRKAMNAGNHVAATNYELLIGFVMVMIGEGGHNIVVLIGQLGGPWPHHWSAPCRALEVAGTLYCVRAITIRQGGGEKTWIVCAAILLFLSFIFRW